MVYYIICTFRRSESNLGQFSIGIVVGMLVVGATTQNDEVIERY